MKPPALIAAALFAAGPATAEVPITIAPTGHAMVPVEGPFGKQVFVFDTGAEGTAVYADFADCAALPAAGTETLQGQTGSLELPLVKISSLAVDGVTAGPIHAIRLDRRADNVRLAGIVGLDLFGGSTIDFDYPAKRLSLLASGTRPVGLKSSPVAATATAGNLLTVAVRIGKTTAVAVLDTGARKTRINWNLGRLLGLRPGKLASGETIQGATNAAVATASAEVSDVRLGQRLLARAPVLVADLPVFEVFGVADRPAIILGLDWLEDTRMVIDFGEAGLVRSFALKGLRAPRRKRKIRRWGIIRIRHRPLPPSGRTISLMTGAGRRTRSALMSARPTG